MSVSATCSLIIDISVTDWTILKPMKEVERRAMDSSVQTPMSQDRHIQSRSQHDLIGHALHDHHQWIAAHRCCLDFAITRWGKGVQTTQSYLSDDGHMMKKGNYVHLMRTWIDEDSRHHLWKVYRLFKNIIISSCQRARCMMMQALARSIDQRRNHQPESWKYKIKNNIDPMLFCYQ